MFVYFLPAEAGFLMTNTAEILQAPEVEISPNRRTDDIIANVRYLAGHIVDKEHGIFTAEAERDVLEQDLSDIAEADIHRLGVPVYQVFDQESGQYFRLGTGTVDNAIKGCEALNMDDEANHFEFYRRVEEITDEADILRPEVKSRMQAGDVKVFISPAPTHHEADPDVAIDFGYDDRTMVRLQSLSPSGELKTMLSFSVFDVPAKAWAAYLGDRYGEEVPPTAIGVMQFCNRVILESSRPHDVIQNLIAGVSRHVDPKDAPSLQRQSDAFRNEQQGLLEQALYYAKEKQAFEKELALSLDDWARPAVLRSVKMAMSQLKPGDRRYIHQHMFGDQLWVDDYIAELAMKIKTVTTNNRAGLATGNERTVKRVASSVGLEVALEMAAREQLIRTPGIDNDLMTLRSEQQLVEANVGCGGGCSVSIVDLFSSEGQTAKDAGLKGNLYESEELNKNSKCGCKNPKVISDGKNVVCTNCKEYKVGSSRGNLLKK